MRKDDKRRGKENSFTQVIFHFICICTRQLQWEALTDGSADLLPSFSLSLHVLNGPHLLYQPPL